MTNKPFNPGFEQGKGISARRLQLMRDRRLTGIRGGRGILVREMDDGEGGIQALVEVKTGLRGSGVVSGGAQIIVAADKAELDGLSPLPEEPAWGYTEDEQKYWALSDGVWVEVGHIVWHTATDKASLPSVNAPAIGYTEDTGIIYTRISDGGSPATEEWVSITHFE